MTPSPKHTTGDWATASTTGVRATAFAANGPAESAHSVAIGKWVRLSEASNAAVVLPPNDEYEPYIVRLADGWAVDTWITFDGRWIVERPDLLLINDGRGYQLTVDGGRYMAGCRNFSYEEAVKHWSNPDHPAPIAAARLLAEVEKHHAKGAA